MSAGRGHRHIVEVAERVIRGRAAIGVSLAERPPHPRRTKSARPRSRSTSTSQPGGGGTYSIDVVTDADALLEKLETIADRPGTEASRRATARRGLRHSRIRSASVLRSTFDDAVVHPTIDFSVAAPRDDLSPSTATIRLTGDVPPGASRFAWNYSWTFASYALRIAGRDDAQPTTEWLEGGESSTPYTIGVTGPRISRTSIALAVFLARPHAHRAQRPRPRALRAGSLSPESPAGAPCSGR